MRHRKGSLKITGLDKAMQLMISPESPMRSFLTLNETFHTAFLNEFKFLIIINPELINYLEVYAMVQPYKISSIILQHGFLCFKRGFRHN